jgi:hypothetical protein
MDKSKMLTASMVMVLAIAASMPAFAHNHVSLSLTGVAENIGPAYDPLFYDVMVYVFGVMIFAIFLMSVIAYWIRRKGVGTSNEAWVVELQRYYEREGIGLLPEESRK